ncbi:MAG: universal stress protein, partial [Leptolyngbyaceae cyanobacterium SU_3_3]|nr:universal stress protein [Leptolyngbyaceae cyanobacterium SU_3_3]
MVHKILVALDQSEMSTQVFEQAISLAKDTHASLMLLNVLSPFEKAYSSASYPGSNGVFFGASEQTVQFYVEHWKRLEQESIEWLRSLEAKAIKAGVEP